MLLTTVFMALKQLFDLNSILAKFQSADIKQKQNFGAEKLRVCDFAVWDQKCGCGR